MSFHNLYQEKKDAFEGDLKRVFAGIQDIPEALRVALEYCLLDGGKRMRPLLLTETYRMFYGEPDENVLKFAVAVECIHCYSLIHDDLPCMDDDDLRRGRPTCHKKFGEAVAVLAGDALLNLAYELMTEAALAMIVNSEELGVGSEELRINELSEAKADEHDYNGSQRSVTSDIPHSSLLIPNSNNVKRYLKAARLLAQSAGARGLIAGQILDITVGEQLSADTLRYIFRHKTGDLIIAACAVGAILGGASKEELLHILDFAEHFAFAFQIKDDILDFEEKKNEKTSFVKMYGILRANQTMGDSTQRAKKELAALGGRDTAFLEKMTAKFASRKE
ncbi:MAG: polyprenyl synthetase family protein [Firmicutes bacterium]|nr:polyprenyl synthetase family protein [Bacillota bacterium]